MKTKLAIIGCGNMGGAIALGIAQTKHNFQFYTYTPTFTRAAKLAKQIKGKAIRKLSDLKGCEYFLIACKPQQFEMLAKKLKPFLNKNVKIISVLAGIPMNKIKYLLKTTKIARAMPNTPCLIGEGACALYFSGMSAHEQKIVKTIFTPIATLFVVKSDDQIHLATSLIGSAPAYFFEIAHTLAAKASTMGFSKKTAEAMIKQVCKGTALLMITSKDDLETLRNNVTSKRGTTEAALKTFKKFKLNRALEKGLKAAYRRAKELS